MKYTGKWWDNPKRNEQEREVASFMYKTLIGIFVVFSILILLVGCAPTNGLSNVYKNTSTEEFSYVGTDIYYRGELCAQMGAIEVAYDDDKIVREVTYIVTDEKFDSIAIGILKYVRERRPSWEVEVELKRELNSL